MTLEQLVNFAEFLGLLVVAIVLIGGLGVPEKPGTAVILMLNGFFVFMWLGSAMLFRKAAREQTHH